MPTTQTIDAANLYALTFAARTDAYARWTGDSWIAVREPLTADVILHAFSTGRPVSGYMLNSESYGHVAALDIDREDGMSLGKQFARRVNDLGGMAYLEGSRRGCHVWIFIDKPRPGIVLRRALKALAHEAGLPDDPKIELRPVSDHLGGEESLGSCLRMPTMPHQTTGIRHILVTSDGEKLSGHLAKMMLSITLTRSDMIDAAAGRSPIPPASSPPAWLRFPFGVPKGEESASDILRELWGVQNARPHRTVRCPAHDDKKASLSISRDDERVWCMAPSCELNNLDKGRGTHELRVMAPAGRGPR